MNKDNSEQEESNTIKNMKKESMYTDNSGKDKSEKKTILNSQNLKKYIFEKERYEKGQF